MSTCAYCSACYSELTERHFNSSSFFSASASASTRKREREVQCIYYIRVNIKAKKKFVYYFCFWVWGCRFFLSNRERREVNPNGTERGISRKTIEDKQKEEQR